ncbi:MAG: 4Fe-4S binding protein [Metallosphaera sp.]
MLELVFNDSHMLVLWILSIVFSSLISFVLAKSRSDYTFLFPFTNFLTLIYQSYDVLPSLLLSGLLGYYLLTIMKRSNVTSEINLITPLWVFSLSISSLTLQISTTLWLTSIILLNSFYLIVLKPLRVRLNSSPLVSLYVIMIGFLSIFLFSVDTLGVSSIQESNLGPWIGLNFLWNSILSFAAIVSSPNFMILMGVWTGVPLVYKIFKSKKLENKIRLTLTFIAYWVYSIYLPSFSPFQNVFPYIPYSWFNGFGTFGPVAPYFLVGILGTYAVTAVLSFLFGSRQICSVTCTAPYMLTFASGLKTFNRSSKLGRKTLTSKMSPIFKITSVLIWINILAFAVISYLNQVNYFHILILNEDPTMFLASLYFNFVWYIQFLLIPFFGDYACVNHGLCGWGTYNQLFSYLGPFKLKVKDPSTCLSCKTVDCAKACPVGLTDMRASFIKKGEFKAFKCIGAGECIEDCTYDNIFIYDGRASIRKMMSKLRSLR